MKTINFKDTNLVLYVMNIDNEQDKEWVKSKINKLYALLKDAYDKYNGCYVYKTSQDLFKKAYRYKIVFNKVDGKIYAVSTYRNWPQTNSFKNILIGGNIEISQKNNEYKSLVNKAVQIIILSDIANWKNFYWVEASGPIAHWEEKYGAYKIPFVYAQKILSKYELNPVDGDLYKYTRKIVGVKDLEEKTMFGFSSKEQLEELLKGDEYYKYELKIQNIIKDVFNSDDLILLNESELLKLPNWYEKIFDLLNYIYEAHTDYFAFYNMTKITYNCIKKCVFIAHKLFMRDMDKIQGRWHDELKWLIFDVQQIYKNANIIELNEIKKISLPTI